MISRAALPLWVPADVVVTDVDDDGRADVLTLAMLSTSMFHREGRLVVYRQRSPSAPVPRIGTRLTAASRANRVSG